MNEATPVAERTVVTLLKATTKMPPNTPYKNFIVYVDDDEDDLEFVSAALGKYSTTLDVVLFEHGYTAYKFLLELEKKGQKPCLIILDINMPVMTGKELLSAIRNISFLDTVPVILFSTSNLDSDHNFAKSNKAGFITKPLGNEQMEQIAEEFLSHCSPEIKEKIRR